MATFWNLTRDRERGPKRKSLWIAPSTVLSLRSEGFGADRKVYGSIRLTPPHGRAAGIELEFDLEEMEWLRDKLDEALNSNFTKEATEEK